MHSRLLDVNIHYFDDCHQENESVFEIVAVDVSEVELRHVSENLDRKYSKMVENGFHLWDVGVHYSLVDSPELHGLWHKKAATVLEPYVGPNCVSGLYGVGYLLKRLVAVEAVSEVQQHSVTLGITVLGAGSFDVVHLV